jgi:hypothetical protein
MAVAIQPIHVGALLTGDVIRFTPQDPWVTVIRVKKDRNGFDLLYAPGGAEPRWRGFDEPDTVERRTGRP